MDVWGLSLPVRFGLGRRVRSETGKPRIIDDESALGTRQSVGTPYGGWVAFQPLYQRIIKEQLDVDEKDIKPESSFIDDLGADSLGLVELVLAFEEAFEIDIPDEDTEKIRTVKDAIDYIEAHTKK